MPSRTVMYADLTKADCKDVVLWGERNEEQLWHADLDEAIENYLDGWYKFDEGVREDGATLEFAGHKRMEPPPAHSDAEWVLEFLLERWDEEMGDPDGNPVKPTKRMQSASLAFVEAVRSEYKGWACEPVIYVTVPVRAWVEQHAPEWLTDLEEIPDEG